MDAIIMGLKAEPIMTDFVIHSTNSNDECTIIVWLDSESATAAAATAAAATATATVASATAVAPLSLVDLVAVLVEPSASDQVARGDEGPGQ